MPRHHWAAANTDCVAGSRPGGVAPAGAALAAGQGAAMNKGVAAGDKRVCAGALLRSVFLAVL